MSHKFQEYNQQQNCLFPPSIEELIPPDNPVRIVNVYAYMDNTYSSRKIEKAMRENINFLLLSNNRVAEHNSLARFRSEKLKSVFKDIFKQVVLLLAEEGLVKLKEVYTDGTKIESVAGRYPFVWGNAIKTQKEKMARQLEKIWQYAQSIADEEDTDPTPPDFRKVDKEKVEKTVQKINKILKGNGKPSSKAKTKARYIAKNFAANLEKYERQEQLLGKRSSYSKTDPDATFMRMKEDHRKNGQLKPGYNVQISSEDQCIVNYTLHQNTNDIHTLRPHLENYEYLYQNLPESHTADAGYGSQENYELLSVIGIKDVCPMGQQMNKITEGTKITKSGYQQKVSKYSAKNCNGCPI